MSLSEGAICLEGVRRIRLAIFTSHPIQYQAPLFRELASRRELDPTVYFGSRHGLDESFDPGFGDSFSWDIPLLDGYRSFFLRNEAAKPDVSSFLGISIPEIASEWTKGRFDAALVLGWNTRGHIQAMRAARSARIPLIIRGESTLGLHRHRAARSRVRSLIWHPVRAVAYRRMFSTAAAILPIGIRNHEYYRAFGVSEERLFPAKYCVENERFALPLDEAAASRVQVRRSLGIHLRATVFTSAAKLIGRKRPFDLLHAFALLCARRPELDIHLLFLGDGLERATLEEAIHKADLSHRVHISGFINQSGIPGWYAASDCLILPSDGLETWGLVVNEAMAAGLPVIVSDAAGCAPNLVCEGENGFTFPLGDVTALADRMEAIAGLPGNLRAGFGQRSRQIVSDFTYARVADAVLAGLRGTECAGRWTRGHRKSCGDAAWAVSHDEWHGSSV